MLSFQNTKFKVFALLLLAVAIQSPLFAQKSKKFKTIFNGKNLKNWEGDTDYWRVENGIMIGEITKDKPLKSNSFLIYSGGQPSDFELKAKFKISESGNSGIQYRSERLNDPKFALKGYQADIDGRVNYTGQNYEERKRSTLAYRGEKATILTQKSGEVKDNTKNNAWQHRNVTGKTGEAQALKDLIKIEDWNEIHIIAKGNVLQHYVNGTLMSEVTDNDTANRSEKGSLGLQLHTGPPMKVEFKDIKIRQ